MRKLILEAPYQMRMTEAPIPAPQRGEVRIRVQRIGVCGSDLTIYRGLHPYVSYPLVMGHEISGVIDAAGADVPGERVGQRVTVIPHLICGQCEACKHEIYNFCEQLRCTGAEADGAHCDYFCIASNMALAIPDAMSIDDAALVEPACVAYHGAKRGNIQTNDTALIIGSGPIGVFCMQSCKALGARRVFVADMDASRLAIATSLGADGVIDVSSETLADGLTRLCGSPKQVDLFYDCVGEKGRVLNDILTLARRGARVVVIGVLQSEYAIAKLPDFVQHELSLSGTTMYVPQDYREMIALLSSGTIRTEGTVSHRFTLEQVPAMLEMLDQRREKTFKILLDIADF